MVTASGVAHLWIAPSGDSGFSGRGYDYACDWWSVGTIMFECLIGWPPFCAEQAHDTYRKIVDWRRHLHFPPEQPLTRLTH